MLVLNCKIQSIEKKKCSGQKQFMKLLKLEYTGDPCRENLNENTTYSFPATEMLQIPQAYCIDTPINQYNNMNNGVLKTYPNAPWLLGAKTYTTNKTLHSLLIGNRSKVHLGLSLR